MRQLKITASITDRSSASLDKYLSEIAKIPVLSIDEEVSLARKIRTGDELALKKMTSANLRFVVSVAKQYQSKGLSLSDLINEGNIGLVKAAHRFDETRGFKFISYAVWWIRQSILQALSEQASFVRLPLNQIGLISKIKKASSEFEQKNERLPTKEELVDLSGLDIDKLETAIHASHNVVSFDNEFNPISGDGQSKPYLDVIADDSIPNADDSLIKESISYQLNNALKILDEREREVLVMFYGIGGNDPILCEEIGFKLKLTRERVRQIKDKAIKRLRRSSGIHFLREYIS